MYGYFPRPNFSVCRYVEGLGKSLCFAYFPLLVSVPGTLIKYCPLQAAKNGNEEDVLEILQGWPGDGRVADIDGFDEDGWTALHFAVFYNHLSVIKALLRKGAGMCSPVAACTKSNHC